MRARRVKRPKLLRFVVETIELGPDGHCYVSDPRGQVLLFWESDARHVEHALVALGVYAPRGLDTVEWFKPNRVAVIRDAAGAPIARLTERRVA